MRKLMSKFDNFKREHGFDLVLKCYIGIVNKITQLT